MRRVALVAVIVGAHGLAACGSSGSGTDRTNSTPASSTPGVPMGNGNPVTGPIDRARSVVDQQNQQLGQEEQRAGSDDPTAP